MRGAPRSLLAAACVVALSSAAGCGDGARRTVRSEPASPAAPPRPQTGSHYSPHLRSTLVRGCVTAAAGVAGAAARCRCTLAYLEAHVPQRTLEVTEHAVLEGRVKEPDWMLNAVVTCARA